MTRLQRDAARVREGRRAAKWVSVVLAAMLVAAACAPEPGGGGGQPSDPGPGDTSLPAPTARHGKGSVSLAWAGEGVPAGDSYEWQWRGYGVADWSTATTSEPEVEVSTGLVPQRFQWARVRAVDGGSPGEWSSGLKFFYSDLSLPVVRIDTEGSAPVVDKDTYLDATLDIDPNGSGEAAYSGTTEIKGRGNSTWSAVKKPYRLKLTTKSELLGMPSNRHWVLLANYFDPSHLRNELAFRLSAQTDLQWTPRFRFVEVVLNGRYDGIYMLGEHVRSGSDRVDIEEMSPEDNSGEALTGGYLLEFDFRLAGSGDPGFVTTTGVEVAVKEPDPPTPEQLNYIRGYLNAFEAAAWGSSFKDPAVGYRAYLDVEAFIDWYLIAEITKQQDSMWSSTFLSKPRNGKLTFGPLWDFDLSMGAVNHLTPGWPPDGWWINVPILGRWVPRLFEDPALRAQLETRWQELKPRFDEVVAGIPDVAAAIEPARAADRVRWGVAPKTADSDQRIQSWLSQRLAWIDSRL